jgi:hypothetical protein
MGWEEKVANAGQKIVNKQIDKENHRDNLKSIVKNVISVIQKVNDNFRTAGLRPREDNEFAPVRYKVSYIGPGINGSISITISNYDVVSANNFRKELIFVTCNSHSFQKKYRYHGNISENEIINWIKFASRQPTIRDKIKKVFGSYYGDF